MSNIHVLVVSISHPHCLDGNSIPFKAIFETTHNNRNKAQWGSFHFAIAESSTCSDWIL